MYIFKFNYWMWHILRHWLWRTRPVGDRIYCCWPIRNQIYKITARKRQNTDRNNYDRLVAYLNILLQIRLFSVNKTTFFEKKSINLNCGGGGAKLSSEPSQPMDPRSVKTQEVNTRPIRLRGAQSLEFWRCREF